MQPWTLEIGGVDCLLTRSQNVTTCAVAYRSHMQKLHLYGHSQVTYAKFALIRSLTEFQQRNGEEDEWLPKQSTGPTHTGSSFPIRICQFVL